MNISVYKTPNHPVKIEQTRVNREWMDETAQKHAYKCFPITLVNTIGFSISYTHDIEFIWDGISDTSPHHVKIIKDEFNVCNTNRGNATISFETGLKFKTNNNISILSIVPPNYFIDGATPFTSVVSTSFFPDSFPAAWRITRPNEKILIPAGTPICTIIPISIAELSEVEIDLYDREYTEEEREKNNKKINKIIELSREGKFTNFYRDAVDYEGNSIGEHEKKSIHLKVNDFTQLNKKMI